MKKYIIIIAAVYGILFTGCDDFLTVESPEFSADKFWRDSVDVEMGLSSVYGQLENRTGSYTLPEVKFVVEAFREDVMDVGGDVANYPTWGELAKFSYNNGNSQLKLYWMNNYNGINYANNVIYGIDKVQNSGHAMTETTYNTLMGEACFLRGYYHMKLLLNWEQIIVRDSYLSSESQTHKALASRDEAWDFIINEFKTATKLPATRVKGEVGRATSGAAYAYMGWAYLTRAYETPAKKEEYLGAALEAFNEVKGYSLEKDFLSMFNGSNKNSKESIFELQFIASTADGTKHNHVMHLWMIAPAFGGWDEIRPSKLMMDAFIKEGRTSNSGEYDARAYATLFFNDPYFNDGTGKVFGYEYQDVLIDYDSSGNPVGDNPCFRKYLPTTLRELGQNTVSTNLPLMRYSNVLLMKAEVLNELNRPEDAIPLINDVRREHGNMPPMTGTTKAEVQAQIEHERLIEFPMENLRFYDLRRWGKLGEAMRAAGRQNFDETKHSFFPVPLMEIQTNNQVR